MSYGKNNYFRQPVEKWVPELQTAFFRNGYHPCLVENDKSKIPSIEHKGLPIESPEKALSDCDVVIFALPDRLLGKLTAQYAPVVNPEH